MSVTVISGRELTSDLIDRWRAAQATNQELAGPFFCPEFTLLVALSRRNVFVAVIEAAGSIALLPFERNGRSGKPAGATISDFQGLIGRPDYMTDIRSIVHQCGLHRFEFDHVLPSQSSFWLYTDELVPSPRIDLTLGFETYVNQSQKAGSKQIRKCDSLRRKIERDIGPITVIHQSKDTEALRKILFWKSCQYLRTGKRDVLKVNWVRETLERVHGLDSDTFAGSLSLLYAGDKLLAGHLGMRTPQVWHYWFTAYDVHYARYSPGLILLLEIAKFAADCGARTLELGKGMSLYKERLMNACPMVAQGHIELSSLAGMRRRALRHVLSVARATAERTGLADPARKAYRSIAGLK